jgi:hypothetical protein
LQKTPRDFSPDEMHPPTLLLVVSAGRRPRRPPFFPAPTPVPHSQAAAAPYSPHAPLRPPSPLRLSAAPCSPPPPLAPRRGCACKIPFWASMAASAFPGSVQHQFWAAPARQGGRLVRLPPLAPLVLCYAADPSRLLGRGGGHGPHEERGQGGGGGLCARSRGAGHGSPHPELSSPAAGLPSVAARRIP